MLGITKGSLIPMWLRLGRAKGSVDLRLDAPGRKRRQPRLRPAGLDLVAELKAPFPEIWFGRRDYGVFNAFVNHCVSLSAIWRQGHFFLPVFNPGHYGYSGDSRRPQMRGCHELGAGLCKQMQSPGPWFA